MVRRTGHSWRPTGLRVRGSLRLLAGKFRLHRAFEGPRAHRREGLLGKFRLPRSDQYGVTVCLGENGIKARSQTGATRNDAPRAPPLFKNGQPPTVAATVRLKSPLQQMRQQNRQPVRQLVLLAAADALDFLGEVGPVQLPRRSPIRQRRGGATIRLTLRPQHDILRTGHSSGHAPASAQVFMRLRCSSHRRIRCWSCCISACPAGTPWRPRCPSD